MLPGPHSPLSLIYFTGGVFVQILNTWYPLYLFQFLNPDSLDPSENPEFNQLSISLCSLYCWPHLYSRYSSPHAGHRAKCSLPSLPPLVSLFSNSHFIAPHASARQTIASSWHCPDQGPGWPLSLAKATFFTPWVTFSHLNFMSH